MKSLPRNFVFFAGSSAAIFFANRLTIFAVSWWVVDSQKAVAAVASMMAIAMIVEVSSRFLFANIGDLYNKQRIVILTNIVSIVSSGCALAVVYFKLPCGMLWPPIVFMSLGTAIRNPVNAALLKQIVSQNFLSRAITINSTINSANSVALPVVAGFLSSLLGAFYSLFVAVLLSCIAAAVMVLVNYIPSKGNIAKSGFINSQIGSLKIYLKLKPEMHLAIICALLNSVLYTFFSVFAPYLAMSMKGGGPWVMGALDAIFSLGLIFSATFLLRKNSNDIFRMERIMTGCKLIGLFFLLISCILLVPDFSGVVLVFIMAGPLIIGGSGLFMVSVNASIIRTHAAPEDKLSSITAYSASLSGSLIPLSLIVAGFTLDTFGIEAYIGACLFVVLAAILILFLSPDMRSMRELKDSDLNNFYAKKYL